MPPAGRVLRTAELGGGEEPDCLSGLPASGNGSLIVSDLLQNHRREDQNGMVSLIAKYLSELPGYEGFSLTPQLRMAPGNPFVK